MKRIHSTLTALALGVLFGAAACGSDPLSDRIEQGLALLEDGAAAAAAASFSEALELSPEDVDLFTLRGIAWLDAGQPRDAVRDLTRALEIDPWALEAYRQRARAFEVLSDDVAAESDYSDAIRIAPEDPTLLASRAELYLRRGDEARAEADLRIAAFTQTIADTDEGSEADALRLERATLWMEQGEAALAAADVALLAERAPNDASLHLTLAALRSMLGESQAEAALHGYERALELALPPESQRDAHLGLASLYESIGAWTEAGEAYANALRLDPDDADALLRRAWFLATAGDPSVRDGALAIELALRGCAADDRPDWVCSDTLAAAHAADGDAAAAIERAQRALRQAPEEARPALRQRLAGYRAESP